MSPPSALQPSKAFLESLFSTFPKPQPFQAAPEASAGSLSLCQREKPTLLTLHALFPTSLLPALDLLDRRLITRLTPQDALHDQVTSRTGCHTSTPAVYYVKSNAPRDGRSRYSRGGDVGVTSYEIRTRAWNCTCSAFAFSAFNGVGSSPVYEHDDNSKDDERYDVLADEEGEEMLDVPGPQEKTSTETRDWQWGGLLLEEQNVPICKHLLACVLAEHWPVAGGMVEEQEVNNETMAGWAAGWGG